MENNLTNTNEEKVEPLEAQGEQVSGLEKPQESFEGKEFSVVDDAAEVLKIEAEVKKLEIQVNAALDGINQINENLGVSKKNIEEIPSLQKKIRKIFNLKGLLKAATFAGLMMGATSAGLSQNTSKANETQDLKEIQTKNEAYLLQLKKYKVVPENMTVQEFQIIAKDKQKMKEINEKYVAASGVMVYGSAEYKEFQKKNPITISRTVFHVDELQEKKFQNKEYTDVDKKKDIEGIWEKVKGGELKYGDIVVLRNGEKYEIKDYKAGSYKKTQGGGVEEIAVLNKETHTMKDYTSHN